MTPPPFTQQHTSLRRNSSALACSWQQHCCVSSCCFGFCTCVTGLWTATAAGLGGSDVRLGSWIRKRHESGPHLVSFLHPLGIRCAAAAPKTPSGQRFISGGGSSGSSGSSPIYVALCAAWDLGSPAASQNGPYAAAGYALASRQASTAAASSEGGEQQHGEVSTAAAAVAVWLQLPGSDVAMLMTHRLLPQLHGSSAASKLKHTADGSPSSPPGTALLGQARQQQQWPVRLRLASLHRCARMRLTTTRGRQPLRAWKGS